MLGHFWATVPVEGSVKGWAHLSSPSMKWENRESFSATLPWEGPRWGCIALIWCPGIVANACFFPSSPLGTGTKDAAQPTLSIINPVYSKSMIHVSSHRSGELAGRKPTLSLGQRFRLRARGSSQLPVCILHAHHRPWVKLPQPSDTTLPALRTRVPAIE